MKYIACYILLFTSFCCTAQEKATDVIAKMAAAVKAHTSLSYTAELRTKSADSKDTTYTQSTVHMLRDSKDTIWGGMIWQSEGLKPETYSFYDMDKRYIVMTAIHKGWKEKPRRDMGLSVAYRQLLWLPFLEPDIIEKGYTKSELSLLNETTISGKPCYVVQMKTVIPYNKQTVTQTLYISKEDYFPLMIWEESPAANGKQYSVLVFSSYDFDKAGKEQFSPKQIPSDYTFGSRDRETPKGVQPQVRPAGEWPIRRR